jgi:hypothetical protein
MDKYRKGNIIMKNKLIINTVGLCSLIFTTNVFSAAIDYASVSLKIKGIAPILRGTYFYFDKNHVCGNTRALLLKTHGNYNALVSTLLATYMSGKSVSVDLRTQGTNTCSGTAPQHSEILNICVGDVDSVCFTSW